LPYTNFDQKRQSGKSDWTHHRGKQFAHILMVIADTSIYSPKATKHVERVGEP